MFVAAVLIMLSWKEATDSEYIVLFVPEIVDCLGLQHSWSWHMKDEAVNAVLRNPASTNAADQFLSANGKGIRHL